MGMQYIQKPNEIHSRQSWGTMQLDEIVERLDPTEGLSARDCCCVIKKLVGFIKLGSSREMDDHVGICNAPDVQLPPSLWVGRTDEPGGTVDWIYHLIENYLKMRFNRSNSNNNRKNVSMIGRHKAMRRCVIRHHIWTRTYSNPTHGRTSHHLTVGVTIFSLNFYWDQPDCHAVDKMAKETGVKQQVYFLSFFVYRGTHARRRGEGGRKEGREVGRERGSWEDGIRVEVRNKK